MNIDIADAFAVHDVAFDESENLSTFGHDSSWQVLQQFQYRRAITQASARNLADHKRMHDDVRSFQQVGE